MIAQEIREWAELVASCLSAIALVVGGCFGLYEYAHKNRSEQIKTSLEFLDRYDRAPYLEARQRAFSFWYSTDYASNLKAEVAKGKNGDVGSFLLANVKANHLEIDINRLTEFYDGLYACTCGGACDADTVVRLFHKYSADLNGNAFPYIAEQRAKFEDKHIGDGLHHLAIEKTGKSLVATCDQKDIVQSPA